MKIRFYGTIIGLILSAIGYCILVTPEQDPQIKRREPHILKNFDNKSKKNKSNNERLVEIIDPDYDKKYPKSN